MKKSVFVDIISCLYVILFLYTGLYKLTGLEQFRAAIADSPLLKSYAPIIAIGIPTMEILIAVLLLLPFFKQSSRLHKWGFYFGTALMGVFAIYVGYMLKTSSSLPCSCGGIIKQLNWHDHFYLNILFTLLGLLAIWLSKDEFKSQQKGISFT